MHDLLDLFWIAGSLCCGLVVLYGAYLAIDFHARASAGLQLVIAQLSLYESLNVDGLVSDAREEVLRTTEERSIASP